MNRHPDQARLKAFRGHRLSGAEFLQVARHLEECGECGEKSGSESGDLLAGLTSRDAADHLSDEELDVLVDGRSDHETYASLSAHVRACRMCRAEVADLRQFAESEASGEEAIRLAPVVAIGRRNRWLAAAAALVFLVALAALVPMLRVKTPAGVAETASSAPATGVRATPAAPR
ncbi:MAG TPA: hypothetical protein VFL80_08530, partial [Thermoanaerobaculia bacterium]|nr:hypothetical protein [Thermoanaerobaculia bacterium]